MKLNRRQMLTACTAAMAGSALSAQSNGWQMLPRVKDGQETLNTARNLIFVLLQGAPSHIDTFDVKETVFTPGNFDVQRLNNGFTWPMGLMPRLGAMTDRFSLIRSLTAVEAVHSRAVYHLLTVHRQTAGGTDIPHFASMISYMLAGERQAYHTLPTSMVIGVDPAKNGFLSLEHQALQLRRDGTIPNLNHFDPETGDDRLALFDALLEKMPNKGGAKAEHLTFLGGARGMMKDAELSDLLGTGDDDAPRGNGSFLDQCATAVEVIAADKGTRVLQLLHGDWDHHVDIYAQGNLPTMARAFDEGFSFLINELAGRPGQNGGSLLDETMVVALGEFGRTTNGLNTSRGRDHYPFVLPAIVAGGGIQSGRIIGRTDATGTTIIDPGWSHRRFMSISDFMATVYSAMGIDWTQPFLDTPSGRRFDMVDNTTWGQAYAIDDLFV